MNHNLPNSERRLSSLLSGLNSLLSHTPFFLSVSLLLRGVSLWQGQGLWYFPQSPCRFPIVFGPDQLLLLRYTHRRRSDMNVLLHPPPHSFSFPALTLSNVQSSCIILLSYSTSTTFSCITSFYISSSRSSSRSFPTFLPHLLLSSSVNVQKALTLI